MTAETATPREGPREKLQRLHREGVVNLDAPLRQAVPELAKRIERAKQGRESLAQGAEDAFRITEWYCLVGSGGFICALKWEVD